MSGPTLEEGFVQANGIRLHYEAWSPAGDDRPQLVMLHANGFLARLWEPVIERLGSRCRVLAFDTRGHGDSDKPDPSDSDNYHWRELTADLRGFLDAFGLRDVPIVGHSSGGAVAAYLAACDPRYFSRMVLVEPIVVPSHMMAHSRSQELAEAARRRREVWSSREEMIESYRDRSLFEHWTEESLRLYAEHGTFRREDGQYRLKCPGAVEARMFENSLSVNIWDELERVECPALVVKGQHTDPFLGLIVEEVARRVPNARHATVPKAGHLVPMEQPEALASLILDFLE